MLKSVEIPVSDVQVGYILDENITENRILLLKKGTIITERHKELLMKRKSVRIIRDVVETVGYMDEKLVDQKLLVLDSVVKQRIYESVSQIFSTTDLKKSAERAENVSKTLVHEILVKDGVGLNVEVLKVSDEYTFKHSVDVAAMGITLGKELGLSEQKLIDIGTAGILHDIGKIKIPPEILNKKGKLDEGEFRIIKNHPVYGYQMMSETASISEPVRRGILHHHEKYCGGGYPSGITGDTIPVYARILCIVDVFDALVTRRPYHEPIPVGDAIEIMYTMSDQFDLKLFNSFMNCLVLYPVGSIVFLSDGKMCQVQEPNEGYPLRPVVKDIASGQRIDLANDINWLTVKIDDIREGLNI